jgi:phosphoenolpyruvate phosphomutase
MKKIYVAFSSDIITLGHLAILKKAKELGDVIVGLLTDEAISSYKHIPIFSFNVRKSIYEGLKGIDEIVVQDSVDYTNNLLKYKPDFVIHGDDWREGIQKNVRAKVIEVLKAWGGSLIEVPYSKDFDTNELNNKFHAQQKSPDFRRSLLRKMLSLKSFVRVLEASNGLTGLIVENTKVNDFENAKINEFDAMWISSLCDSTFKGKPDIELVDLTSRLNTINEIMEVTTKPIILDGDTGGREEHFIFNVKTLERIGVSAIIIEDKTGLKRNSLFGTEVKQELEDPEVFASKIRAGKRALLTRDFLIFARLESLIAGYDVFHALDRAKKYIEAGADGVMIHSKDKEGKDIIQFMQEFRKYSKDIPIIVVPTAYNHISENELARHGANIIIHANHLLRSAYPAMVKTALSILEHGRSKEADPYLTSIKDIIKLIPGGE